MDLNQELNGLAPSGVLLLNFMRKQNLNAILDDLDQILKFAHEIEERVGPFDRVISFNEATNYAAAAVRESLGVEGDSREVATKFRDKWVMSEVFRTAGIPTPDTRLVLDPTSESLVGMSDVVIVKPRDQAASRGAFKSSRAQFASNMAGREVDEAGVIVQDFVVGDFYHFDVAYRLGAPEFIGINRYIYHGMDWSSGRSPMASVTETNLEKIAKATELIERIGVAFEVGDRVLHIEAFWTEAEGFVLIELASRPGGALIVPTHQAAGGPNLEAECILRQIQDREEPRPVSTRYSREHGWIVTPLPGFGPFVVTGSNFDQLGLSEPPALALVPQAGTILHDRYRYRNPEGKFVFLGPSSSALIEEVARSYKLSLIEIEVGAGDYWLG